MAAPTSGAAKLQLGENLYSTIVLSTNIPVFGAQLRSH
jgi:hypothetical protein